MTVLIHSLTVTGHREMSTDRGKRLNKIQLCILSTITLHCVKVRGADVCKKLVSPFTEMSVPIVFRGGQYKAECSEKILFPAASEQ